MKKRTRYWRGTTKKLVFYFCLGHAKSGSDPEVAWDSVNPSIFSCALTAMTRDAARHHLAHELQGGMFFAVTKMVSVGC